MQTKNVLWVVIIIIATASLITFAALWNKLENEKKLNAGSKKLIDDIGKKIDELDEKIKAEVDPIIRKELRDEKETLVSTMRDSGLCMKEGCKNSTLVRCWESC